LEVCLKEILYHPIVFWSPDRHLPLEQALIGEEPLSIRIQGKPYSVVMRTPGKEKQHVAGFCLSEGIVDTLDEIKEIAFCDGADTNVVTVTLTAARIDRIPHMLERREFISQTSCGLCGKTIVEDLYQSIRPLKKQTRIDIRMAFDRLDALAVRQPLRRNTKASHAAVLFDSKGDLLAVAEDVGRHNALDKAVGSLFLEKRLHRACLLVLSSRISYELVQKAARARIPIILAKSRPTALAVDLAEQLNMTLACTHEAGLYIFCNKERLVDRP
jgi:FdhD protein